MICIRRRPPATGCRISSRPSARIVILSSFREKSRNLPPVTYLAPADTARSLHRWSNRYRSTTTALVSFPSSLSSRPPGKCRTMPVIRLSTESCAPTMSMTRAVTSPAHWTGTPASLCSSMTTVENLLAVRAATAHPTGPPPTTTRSESIDPSKSAPIFSHFGPSPQRSARPGRRT